MRSGPPGSTVKDVQLIADTEKGKEKMETTFIHGYEKVTTGKHASLGEAQILYCFLVIPYPTIDEIYINCVHSFRYDLKIVINWSWNMLFLVNDYVDSCLSLYFTVQYNTMVLRIWTSILLSNKYLIMMNSPYCLWKKPSEKLTHNEVTCTLRQQKLFFHG